MVRIATAHFLAISMVTAAVVAGVIAVSEPALAQALNRSRLFAEATIPPAATYPSSAGLAASTSAVGSVDGNGYTAAPVPDAEEAAPVLRALGPSQAEWAPSIFQPGRTYRGEGFVPGSSVQASQRRSQHPAPGISLSVPLQ